jgi:hypothetical protein
MKVRVSISDKLEMPHKLTVPIGNFNLIESFYAEDNSDASA